MLSRLRFLITLGIVISFLGMGIAASASTPGFQTTDPAACLVEPRLFSELEYLASQPIPERDSLASPVSEKHPGIREAVTQTVLESIACVNANNPLRWLAPFSDQYIAWRFGPDHSDDPGHLEVALTRSPATATTVDRLSLLEISGVAFEPDGRVVSIVQAENRDNTFIDRVWFRWDGFSWLIDETVPADQLQT